jgi:glutamate 5-kinase
MSSLHLKRFRRIVVKVGSSLLIDSEAGEVRAAWLTALAADIAGLHGEGRDVLIVSSGSIALGRSRLKLPRGALKLEESQAAAAQCALHHRETARMARRACHQRERHGRHQRNPLR